MILYIDTTKNSLIEIYIKKAERILVKKEFEARLLQAEKLLPEIEKMLNGNKVSLRDLKQIRVNSEGSSFTALRIGIITANTLSYALDMPIKNFAGKSEIIQKIEMVKPEYDRDPDITVPKRK